jgi:hypothetical protein
MRIIFVCLTVSFLFGCSADSGKDIPSFIPGDYEHAFDDEVLRGKIVLRISHVQEDHYAIERLSATIRKRNGIELPVKYDTAHWTAIYDKQQHALYEQQKGKILLFLPTANKLMIGSSEYKKIKQ